MEPNNSAAGHLGADFNSLILNQNAVDLLTIQQQGSLLPGLLIASAVGLVAEEGYSIESKVDKSPDLVDVQQLVQFAVLPLVQSKFQELYGRADWDKIFTTAFGPNVDLMKGKELLSQLASAAIGQVGINVKVVKTSELEAQGAFGNNEIFLGDELVRMGDVQAIAQVVVEEIGHSLDRKLNIVDAAGDEGEIFARLVFDKPLDAMELAILKAEDDSAVREIAGQGLAVELSAFPIQGSIRTFYDQANGVETLGNPLNALQSYAGGLVQDFERGIIFQSAAGTFVARGAIGELYRFRFAVIGLPTGNEVATSFGVRQNFGNKIVLASPQFGAQILLENVAGFYKSLTEQQRSQLGAAYTGEQALGSGNSRQYFQGGTIEWKSNGTGEVKLAPYLIGVNGTAVNQVVLDKFNQANGWETLGKPLNALQSYAGGLVQDFEKGIIFQSAAGTFVARGAIGELYRFRFALIGLPTGDEVVTSFGVRQNFGNKIVFSTPQFGTQILLDNVATFYRGLTDGQRDQLGAPYSSELSLVSGGFRQFFKGGTIEWKANGTGEIKYTSYPIGFNGSSVDNAFLFKFNTADGFTTFGNPTGNVRAITGGSIQDFERGVIIQTNAGIFALDTYVSFWYRQDPSALGLPTGDKVSIAGGFKQEFEKGIVFGNSSNQTFILKDSFATYYRGLSATQVQELGAVTSNFVPEWCNSEFAAVWFEIGEW
jgi:uncharacterized protein with LGFP repeats